jgi:hypothetical protein
MKGGQTIKLFIRLVLFYKPYLQIFKNPLQIRAIDKHIGKQRLQNVRVILLQLPEIQRGYKAAKTQPG